MENSRGCFVTPVIARSNATWQSGGEQQHLLTLFSISSIGLCRFVSLFLIVALFANCRSAAKNTSVVAAKSIPVPVPAPLSSAPDVLAEMESDGFIDLLFFVKAHKLNPDGSQLLDLVANYHEKPIGFSVLISPVWKASSLTDPGSASSANSPSLIIHRGEVTFKSNGAVSDEFVHCLDELYKINRKSMQMKPEIEFTGISLEGNPKALVSELVKIKLFYEPKDPNGYAEIFLNIDLPNRKAHLDEKDEEYRKPLLRAFSK